MSINVYTHALSLWISSDLQILITTYEVSIGVSILDEHAVYGAMGVADYAISAQEL